MAKVAFIGLGVMGYSMAGWLSQNSFDVRVFNRTTSIAQKWVKEYNGSYHEDLTELVENVDFVISCIGKDDDLRQIYEGDDGVIGQMKSGSIIIDHTTASAKVSRELYELAKKRNIEFIDAPISGGQQGAENGQLTIMCGGDEKAFEKSLFILKCYGKSYQLLGPSGSGQLTKMVNQICIAGLLQGLSEGLHFAKKANLDQAKVIDVISKGAAQSWQMENRSATMIAGEYNHGFAIDHMRKDLAICLDEARENGAKIPVAALVDQFYADIQDNDGGRFDTSSLLSRLE